MTLQTSASDYTGHLSTVMKKEFIMSTTISPLGAEELRIEFSTFLEINLGVLSSFSKISIMETFDNMLKFTVEVFKLKDVRELKLDHIEAFDFSRQPILGVTETEEALLRMPSEIFKIFAWQKELWD